MRVPFHKLPHYRKLFLAYAESFGNVERFYHFDPAAEESFPKRFEYLSGRSFNRDVAGILEEQNRSYGAAPEAVSNAGLLKNENTAVVVTGQQAGLFGGPMYALIKAACAIRFAEHLRGRFPDWKVVPVFWIAADDHDFEEVSRFRWIGTDGREHYCEFTPEGGAAGMPVGSVRIDEGIAEAFECFFTTIPETEFTAKLRSDLERFYAPGELFADAFARLLSSWLSSRGLVILNPTDSRLKSIGAPVFAHALEFRDRIYKSIEERNRLLDGAGYHQQIGLPPDGTNLFLSVDGRREALRVEDGAYVTEGGEKLSMSAIAKIIAESPERISPNVVLRPAYQDTLLPTAASIVGPSEIAYYAQISGAFELLDMAPPVYLPRHSLTVLEHRVEKFLREIDLEWWECASDREEIVTKVVRAKLPVSIEEDIEHFKREMAESTRKLQEKVVEFEPTLEKPLEKMAAGFSKYAEGIEKKVRQAYKHKNQVWVERVNRAVASLFPARGFQERFFGALYYLNKYGPGVIDRVVDELNPNEIGHHWIVL